MIPDFRDKVIHIKKCKYVTLREEQFGALIGEARYFALMTVDVRINKLFAVDKLYWQQQCQNSSDSN